MAHLVQRSPVPIDWLEIRVGPRDLHIIVGRTVEGAIAADAEIGAGRGDQRFGFRQDQTVWHRRGRGYETLGKVLALIGIEDREAFEERDRTGFIPIAFRTLAFVIRNEAVGIDNRRAVLAFADVAANAQGLAEGEPTLADEALRDDGVPEDKYIHAGVSAPRGCILRHGERRLRRRRSPRLDPGHAARLQLG